MFKIKLPSRKTEERISRMERELGIGAKKEKLVASFGGLLVPSSLLWDPSPTVFDRLDRLENRIRETDGKVNDIMEFLDIEYVKESKRLAKVVEETPKTWKDKLVDAIDDAISERGY